MKIIKECDASHLLKNSIIQKLSFGLGNDGKIYLRSIGNINSIDNFEWQTTNKTSLRLEIEDVILMAKEFGHLMAWL